jgi:uncharacterized damage-inducible protein DinB
MQIFRSLFEHMAWADARVLHVLTASPSAVDIPGVLRWLAHLVAAERVWLMRLQGQDTSAQPIWPDWDIEAVRQVASENAAAFRGLVAETRDEELGRIVEYRNSQGALFRTAAVDILSQVALHGSYHRGQIAAALRAGGVEPVNTDYITFARERGAQS